MKVSLVITVLNESDTILKLLKSVDLQTQAPDELVIVDGGSTDNTIQLIKQFQQQNLNFSLQLIKAKGLNRSQGRNLAIKKAKFKIITVTDAGCVLDKKWLEQITSPFNNQQIKVVAGAYYAVTDSLWSQTAAQSASVDFGKINPQTFLASSRSIAFRKSAWEKIGGYPENLNTAEDLVFAQRLQNAGFKQAFTPQAMVEWHFPDSTIKIMKQFYTYAYGDGLSKFESHHSQRYLVKTIFIFLLLIGIPSNYSLIMFTLLILWFMYKSVLQSNKNPEFYTNNFHKGLFIGYHLGWAFILFPITLVGYWIGVGNSIIKSRP